SCAGQFLLQAGGQVGIGVLLELLGLREERVAGREDVGAINVPAELVATALAGTGQPAIAHEIDEPRLPAVVIGLTKRRFQLDLAAQTPDGIGVDEQVVAFRERRRRELRDTSRQIERAVDGRGAVEWRPPPRMRELALLGKRAPGLAEPIDGAAAVAAAKRGRARPPQRTPESVRWFGE